jgi:transcriptional regulator with XRE-family HTH domain
MSAYRLDVPTLYAYLDAKRQRNGLSWRAVARETGLASSTLTRIGHGDAPDAHALLTLITWLGLGRDLAPLLTLPEAEL